MVISLLLWRPCSMLSTAQEQLPRGQVRAGLMIVDDLPRPACATQDEGIPCIKEKGLALPLEARFGMDMTKSVRHIAKDIHRQVTDLHSLDPIDECGDVFVILLYSSPAPHWLG